jgi:hypothetical protein
MSASDARPAGGRLTGPGAGWQNLLRDFAGESAIRVAEAYAHGALPDDSAAAVEPG